MISTRQLFILCAAALLFAACRHHQPKPKPKGITYACAVLITPPDARIAELKKTTGDEEYNTIVDDNGYYYSQSATYLDSVKINQIARESKGKLTFQTTGGRVFVIDLSKYLWAVILFNGHTKPIEADMTNIGDDYKRYMK